MTGGMDYGDWLNKWRGDDDGLLDTAKLPANSGTGAGGYTWERCAAKHKPLTLPNGKVIQGGSCSSPIIANADVYVGFDGSMTFGRAFPWHGGAEVLLRIQDQGVPADAKEFRRLAVWVLQQLDEGRNVHCGCIGGHGRTGMFLAALVAMLGEKNAIQYVRKNYCDKAVESAAQIEFLGREFGATKAAATKGAYKAGKHQPAAYQQDSGLPKSGKGKHHALPAPSDTGFAIRLPGNVWGATRVTCNGQLEPKAAVAGEPGSFDETVPLPNPLGQAAQSAMYLHDTTALPKAIGRTLTLRAINCTNPVDSGTGTD